MCPVTVHECFLFKVCMSNSVNVVWLQGQMIMQDKLEKERTDAKNCVEEYVYEMRDKLSYSLEKFIKEQVRIYRKDGQLQVSTVGALCVAMHGSAIANTDIYPWSPLCGHAWWCNSKHRHLQVEPSVWPCMVVQ